jgi:hypothetical protein
LGALSGATRPILLGMIEHSKRLKITDLEKFHDPFNVFFSKIAGRFDPSTIIAMALPAIRLVTAVSEYRATDRVTRHPRSPVAGPKKTNAYAVIKFSQPYSAAPARHPAPGGPRSDHPRSARRARHRRPGWRCRTSRTRVGLSGCGGRWRIGLPIRQKTF